VIKQPLAEVFGFPIDNDSEAAKRARKLRLCPFSNKGPNCSKDKAENPLGVCSIHHDGRTTIVCPVRFRENWIIIEESAKLFFPPTATWTTFTDIKLFDKNENSLGILDFVLVQYDHKGAVVNFGILETQASYVTKNLRRPFEAFVRHPLEYLQKGYLGQVPYPDFSSSIQRRMAPRLIFKGSIFHTWQKKMAIAIDKSLFDTLPELIHVNEDQSEVIWLIYELELDPILGIRRLVHSKTVFTLFEPTLFEITHIHAGPLEEFVTNLQDRLDERLDSLYPPDPPGSNEFFSE